MELTAQNWYSSWFDTPYYHILYKDRNEEEAQRFMRNLTTHLALPEGSQILDLACGKGRHALYLYDLGYEVTGVDLSPRSIAFAKQYENKRLRFHRHCMREPVAQKFDAVFNLFTSLGYFEDEINNLHTIQSIKENLKPGGYGVIDFMNVHKVAENLVASEVKTVEDIDFNITRKIDNGYIVKEIAFEHEGQPHHYQEKVKAINLPEFREYFKRAGIQLLQVFGDYELSAFNEKTSDRLILIFE